MLEGLWRGDLGDVNLGPNPVVINEFRSYSTKLANLLLMTEPVAEGLQITAEGIEEATGEA